MRSGTTDQKAQLEFIERDRARLAAIEALPGSALGKFLKSNTLSSENAFWYHLGKCLKESTGLEPTAKQIKDYWGRVTYNVKKLEDGKAFPQAAGEKVKIEVAAALAQGEEVYSYHYARFSGYFYKITGTLFSIQKPGQSDRKIIGSLIVSIDGRDDFTLRFGQGEAHPVVLDSEGVAQSGKISIAHDYGHYHATRGKYVGGKYQSAENYTEGEESELSKEIDKAYDITSLENSMDRDRLAMLKLFKIKGSENANVLY